MKRILFKGKEFLFGGDSLEESGVIASREEFENFTISYAYYLRGCGVMRFNRKIGEKEDIQIIGDAYGS